MSVDDPHSAAMRSFYKTPTQQTTPLSCKERRTSPEEKTPVGDAAAEGAEFFTLQHMRGAPDEGSGR